MAPAPAAKLKPTPAKATADRNPVVASDTLKRTEVWGQTDPAVRWAGAFAVSPERLSRPHGRGMGGV